MWIYKQPSLLVNYLNKHLKTQQHLNKINQGKLKVDEIKKSKNIPVSTKPKKGDNKN